MSVQNYFFRAAILLIFATCVHADVVLQDMQGVKIPFSSLQGKWVFINYWASWCKPCLDEIPELNQFYEQNKPGGNIAMYSVNYDALSLDAQKILLKQLDIRYPALAQNPADSLQLGNINGVPVTFVFNPQGDLADTLYGGQTVRSLSQVFSSN